MLNSLPNNLPEGFKEPLHEFNEDMLEFLALLVEEYLRVEKLNKFPPPE